MSLGPWFAQCDYCDRTVNRPAPKSWTMNRKGDVACPRCKPHSGEWVTVEMNERQVAFLKVLSEAKKPMGSLAVYLTACPDEPYRGRRDAGATRTADSLSARGYVRQAGEWHSSSRDFEITDEGREALRDLASEAAR